VLSTPSPAITMSSTVSTTARSTTALRAGLVVRVVMSKDGPRAADRVFA
jgi:hypothetical protein